MGDTYILVNEAATGKLAYAVRVHEMTHYLQWKHKRWTGAPENVCKNEREAFDVSNAVVRRLGAVKYVVDWNVVKDRYGC